MMNPLTKILAALVTAGLCLGIGGYAGYGFGVDKQKADDQIEFSRIANERIEQIAIANNRYQELLKKRIADMAEFDKLKSELEKEREQNRITTDGLLDQYATLKLRYRSVQSTANRDRCGSTGKPSDGSTDSTPAEVTELPDVVAGNLRRLAHDADKLNDDYRQCYSLVTRGKCHP